VEGYFVSCKKNGTTSVSERQYPSDIIRVGATRTPLFDYRPSRFPLLLFWFSFFYPSVPHAAITDENAKIFPNIFFPGSEL